MPQEVLVEQADFCFVGQLRQSLVEAQAASRAAEGQAERQASSSQTGSCSSARCGLLVLVLVHDSDGGVAARRRARAPTSGAAGPLLPRRREDAKQALRWLACADSIVLHSADDGSGRDNRAVTLRREQVCWGLFCGVQRRACG